eukprot:4579632-Pyramimonas_sp.AAC.1
MGQELHKFPELIPHVCELAVLPNNAPSATQADAFQQESCFTELSPTPQVGRGAPRAEVACGASPTCTEYATWCKMRQEFVERRSRTSKC